MPLRILHTNDLHGKLDGRVLDRLRDLRAETDLYFDSGDVIRAGNLAIPMRADPAWQHLRELGCSGSVLGNRETHVLEAAFSKKLEGASHPILCANLDARRGSPTIIGGVPILRSQVMETRGVRVGVFGVMVPMVTAKMKTQAVSAYLWQSPLDVATRVAAELRPHVDLLIALTHIGHRHDRMLAERCPDIDVVLGGHSHTVVEQPVRVGRTWVCQGGSHGRYAGVYEWSEDGLTGGLVSLAEPGTDPRQ